MELQDTKVSCLQTTGIPAGVGTVSVLSDAHQRVCVIVNETKVSCLQTTGIPAGVGLCQCWVMPTREYV